MLLFNAKDLVQALFALVMLLLIPAGAQAQQRQRTPAIAQTEERRIVRLSDDLTTTSISGNSATHYAPLRGPRHYVLKGLRFAERSDEPCYVAATFVTARHGAGRDDVVTEATTELCAFSGNDQENLNVGNTPATLEAIHGIRVGLNRHGDKLKAVTIYGSTIDHDASGEVRREPGMQAVFERNNFKKPWQNRVQCPAGEVAVGVLLYYNQEHTYPSIEGIALECAAATVQTALYRAGSNTLLRRID